MRHDPSTTQPTFNTLASRIVQAVSRSIAAIRKAQPEASVLLCDAFENFQTSSPSLQAEVEMRNLRRFIVHDLLAGRVDHQHPLHHWLTSFGFSELDLAFLNAHPQMPDIVGIDYYLTATGNSTRTTARSASAEPMPRWASTNWARPSTTATACP